MRHWLSALLLASAGGAADVLVMRGGEEIYGTVISEDGRQVVIAVDGHSISFDVVLVFAVRRGVCRPQLDPERQLEADAVRMGDRTTPVQPSTWPFSLGLGAGWLSGDVEGKGDLRVRATGAASSLASVYDLTGIATIPGIRSRLTWEPGAPAASPLLGVQVGYGGISGSEASSVQASLALVGGWSLPLRTCRLALLAEFGLAQSSLDRTISLPGGEQIDDSSTLTGWQAGLMINVSRPISSSVALSADVGVHHARLTGVASWDSPTYHGVEDLAADITSIQAGVGLAWLW